MERLTIASPVRKTYESGVTVEVHRLDIESRPIPGETAIHEAAHVVAAGRIKSATIVPSGEALGTTVPVKLTAAAAAAPESLGHRGTSWDMYVTEHILGVDPGTAKAAARAALSGREEEMYEVAAILQKKKTIVQGDVEDARTNVINNRFGIHPVEVTITMPNGQANTRETQSFHGEVRIHDLLLDSSSQS